MNIAAVITASVFLILSVAVLIYLFVGNSSFAKGKYKMFYRACCGVYVSGTVLILLFACVLKNIPVLFVVVSNIAVLCVFVFTAVLVFFMTRSIVETAAKAQTINESKDQIKNEESGNKEDK